MDLLTSLSQFHLLRPLWLLLLVPAAALMWSVYWRSDSLRAWRQIISPELLKHLLINDQADSGRWRPVYILGLAWLIGIFAVAGPSWQTRPSPFSEDQAAIFILLKVTPEMLAQDIQPSRLQRSVMKIQDLLELKKDLRSGLVAYAGSAHLVMPLTSDRGIINDFAAALEPAIMPEPGDEAARAIALASQRLQQTNVPGSIVLFTDAIGSEQLAELKKIYSKYRIPVHILAMAATADVIPPVNSPPAPALDLKSLQQAAKSLNGSVTTVSADKSDIETIARRIDSSLNHAPEGEGQQWLDAGYYLLPLLALLLLTFFRRGGAVSVE